MNLKWAIRPWKTPKRFVVQKGSVDHSTITRWFFKKFHSGCKNLDNEIRSGGPKTVDSKVMFQAIEADLVSSI